MPNWLLVCLGIVAAVPVVVYLVFPALSWLFSEEVYPPMVHTATEAELAPELRATIPVLKAELEPLGFRFASIARQVISSHPGATMSRVHVFFLDETETVWIRQSAGQVNPATGKPRSFTPFMAAWSLLDDGSNLTSGSVSFSPLNPVCSLDRCLWFPGVRLDELVRQHRMALAAMPPTVRSLRGLDAADALRDDLCRTLELGAKEGNVTINWLAGRSRYTLRMWVRLWWNRLLPGRWFVKRG